MHDGGLEQTDILYRKSGLLAINKPAGVPVHGSRILRDQPETLLAMARNHLGHVVHTVHRLDRPVSGIMLLAENQQIQAQLGRIFEQRQVKKCYLAVARGWPDKQGTITHPLLPPRDDRKTSSIAREAVTHFKRITKIELPEPVPPYATSRYSLLALYPQTGRRHQLRRHMKHISHHLIGDTTYGRGEHNRLFREQYHCRRLLLHAWSLELIHPENRENLKLQAPLDSAFSKLITAFGWDMELSSWDQNLKSGAAGPR
jgi:tRNA pseudouridine65 synthase